MLTSCCAPFGVFGSTGVSVPVSKSRRFQGLPGPVPCTSPYTHQVVFTSRSAHAISSLTTLPWSTKLNSYWTYRQVGNDVQIDLLSLSLSRDIPWAIRPMARPIINRIGRESLTRTLDTVRTRATIGRT